MSASTESGTTVPAGDVEAATLAEAEAGAAAARAALDAVKLGEKVTQALAELHTHKESAEAFRNLAQAAAEAAEEATTRGAAEELAEEAEEHAAAAAEKVAECEKAFRRAQRSRTACRKAAAAAAGALYATEADGVFRRTNDAVEAAKELVSDAKEAAEEARQAADEAAESADRACLTCGHFLCACSEICAALLARHGSGVVAVIDPESVRIGELMMSDSEEMRCAGQLMLCGEWEEAEEMITGAGAAGGVPTVGAVEESTGDAVPSPTVGTVEELAAPVVPVKARRTGGRSRVRPSTEEGWEIGRLQERAAALKGWATPAEAREWAGRYPEILAVGERFDRYEGKFRASAILCTVHMAGVEFPARHVFGEGWTFTLPGGEFCGQWPEVVRAIRDYVMSTLPAFVVARGELAERSARIIAEREAEYAAAKEKGLRALDTVRTDLDRVRTAYEAIRTIEYEFDDDRWERVLDVVAAAARGAENCERLRRDNTARWWECLPQYADAVRRAAEWLTDGAARLGVAVRPVARVVTVAPDAPPSDPGAVDSWESEGGACPGVDSPHGPDTPPAPALPPASGPGAGTPPATMPQDERQEAAEVRAARRRADSAAANAVKARSRAEAMQGTASAHYERFAGGQPILMGHGSARSALRDRARGDAATRRAIAATGEAERAEVAARGARLDLERAEIVHGRSRAWTQEDFRPGDVVAVRKRHDDSYVVVRANPKTLTLRNAYTIDDTRARYDQVLSRTRDGRTVTDPGCDDAPCADRPANESDSGTGQPENAPATVSEAPANSSDALPPAADSSEEGAAERAVRLAGQRVRVAEETYERAQLPGMWKDTYGRKVGTTSALRALYGARKGLAAVNGAPFLAVPEMSATGEVKRWDVLECSPHPTLGTVTRSVCTTHYEQNAEAEAFRRNRLAEYERLMTAMRADMDVIESVWTGTDRYSAPVRTDLAVAANHAREDARRAAGRAEGEQGTGAADRCAPFVRQVAEARRTVERYAAHRAEAQAAWERRESARREEACAVRAAADVKAAAGRDPLGTLPKAWADALCDVARGQVHTLQGVWQKVTYATARTHRSQRALSALLALGLIAEADDVAECGTPAREWVRVVTLSALGVRRFDKFGQGLPGSARQAACEGRGAA